MAALTAGGATAAMVISGKKRGLPFNKADAGFVERVGPFSDLVEMLEVTLQSRDSSSSAKKTQANSQAFALSKSDTLLTLSEVDLGSKLRRNGPIMVPWTGKI